MPGGNHASHDFRRSAYRGSHQRTRAQARTRTGSLPAGAANARAGEPDSGNDSTRVSSPFGGTPDPDPLRSRGVSTGSSGPPPGTALIVVSDTSPVLNLARIGRLDLLQLLYQQVLIPSSVYQELTASKNFAKSWTQARPRQSCSPSSVEPTCCWWMKGAGGGLPLRRA